MARVLIVDDSAFSRNLLKQICERGGHEVVGHAGTSEEALNMYKALEPELVTLDHLMPQENGEVILKAMLAHDSEAKVIMISGSGDNTLEDRALQGGAKAFMEKPCVESQVSGHHQPGSANLMAVSGLALTERQVESFDRFLLDHTGGTLDVLENMFGLTVDSSDSRIEVAPAANSENLKNLGNGTLYVVSSSMVGDMQGRILLLMRSIDFDYLSEVMRPVLSLLFLSSPDDDLETLDGQVLDWIEDNGTEQAGAMPFREQMVDTMTEMGNVLIGLYSKAIYRLCNLNSHHFLPHMVKDPKQRIIQRVMSSSNGSKQPFLVIENEFVVTQRSISLWCLISPTEESFRNMLEAIG